MVQENTLGKLFMYWFRARGYVLCAESKKHKFFCLGTQPAGSAIGVTEKLVMCQMFMCLFAGP